MAVQGSWLFNSINKNMFFELSSEAFILTTFNLALRLRSQSIQN